MTLKCKYGSVELVVKRASVLDDLHAQIISQTLRSAAAVGEYGMWDLFAELCAQTTKAKGLTFNPVGLHQAENGSLEAAYSAFLGLDKGLKDLWKKTVDQANKPVDEITGPVPADDDGPN